ncbi:MAG: radical SAM protein, partial [Bacteroidetes bacterium CG_4_10_14_3_um_filter_42_6]
GIQDKTKHLATLFLEDLSDFIVECIDEHFGFSRYAERLGTSANSFDELHGHLQKEPTYIEQLTWKILEKQIKTKRPKLVCFSVPFPGNLTSAFRCAQLIKAKYPHIKTVMGGGYPNTELRSITDERVFNFFDYITLDDGELPLELLISNTLNPRAENPHFNLLKRTFLRVDGQVVYNDASSRPDYKQSELGVPDYTDLLLDQYVSVIEVANPMHSLWSDGRWNKLTMAHGCYWAKCTFCDTTLDYIKAYEPIAAKLLVDRMEQIIAQTGEKGFHFVDEAAPPTLMRALAIEIIRRKITVSWWTNVRFEKSYTRDLCTLLQSSGCIAVSGGLEVASDRLLALINKGVTVEQVAQVTRNFTDAGIMVHAYLMYGFPTQT